MRLVRSLGLMIAAFVVAGCGSSTGTSQEAGSAPEVTQNAAGGPPRSAAQLQFTSKTVDGKEFSGQTLAGKPAVLWFWAPWCPTCQREAPGVAKVAQANTKVTFVGVAAQDQLPPMREFVDKYKVDSFTHLADLDASVWRRFGVTAQPAYAFIGADGSVDVVKGSLSEQDLTARVDALTNT